MSLSVDQIVEKFRHKYFPDIDDKPYYHIIPDMWILLYINDSNLTMMLGGDNHRHIWIVMQEMLYATISPMTYVAPVDPVVTATVPLKVTIAQHLQI